MSTNVSSVASHFPDVENGFSTTLASTIASGAGTVPLNSVAGYINGEPAVFVVDPADATKKQTFTGIIDTAGVQVTSVVWTAGTNQQHTAGATVVDYATATHIAMISKGIKVHANQDGTLKSSAVDTAISAGSIDTAQLADAAVTPAKLVTGSGTSWAWQTYTPTPTNFSVGNGTINFAKYTQIGKTVHVRIKVTFGTTSSVSGGLAFSLPVQAHAEYVDNTPLASQVRMDDNSASAAYGGLVSISSVTVAKLQTYGAGGTFTDIQNISNTLPVPWANLDYFVASFSYEAA